MSRPLAIGVAGCGYWGANLARIFNQLEGSTLAAVCDVSAERRERMAGIHPGVRVHADFAALIADPAIDAVAVATPAARHHEQGMAVLASGRHLFLEKPMARSSRECRELTAEAERSGRILMVDHTCLHSDAVSEIRRMNDAGDFGGIRHLSFQRLSLGIRQPDVNVAWDLAPHDLSILLAIAGEMPAAVACQGSASGGDGIEDVIHMSLRFPSGLFATVQNSWIEPRKVRQMTLVGERRMLVFDDLEPHEKIRIHDSAVGRPPHYESFGEFSFAYHYGDCFIPRFRQREPLAVACGSFLEAIRSGVAPESDGSSGEKVVRILEASDRSLRGDGGFVSLDG